MSVRFRPTSRNQVGGKFWEEFYDWSLGDRRRRRIGKQEGLPMNGIWQDSLGHWHVMGLTFFAPRPERGSLLLTKDGRAILCSGARANVDSPFRFSPNLEVESDAFIYDAEGTQVFPVVV